MPGVEEVKAWYNQHYAGRGLQSMRPREAYPLFLTSWTHGPGPDCWT